MRGSTARLRQQRSVALVSAVALSVLAFDQLTKFGIDRWLGPGNQQHRWVVIGDALALEYAENRGMAFGLLQGQTAMVTVLALGVIALAVYAFRQLREVPIEVAIGGGLVGGGAIGNLIDRVRLGYVIDFMAVWTWPNFNLADSAITIGALLIAWRYLREREPVDRTNGIHANVVY